MTAHFIDVGQGAAVLLEFPCGLALIDTGGPDEDHIESLISYLDAVMQRRPDRNNTLDLLFITHPHLDHTRGLRRIADRFDIVRYVDCGQTKGSGAPNVTWMRKMVQQRHFDTRLTEVSEEDFPAKRPWKGIHNSKVDNIKCATCDPKITVLSGGYESNPGWGSSAFENMNNHSLVIRVDFDKASFLFSGDLEEEGIETLLENYQGTNLLDIDVYHVGHHGSNNATTTEFLDALTPKYSVISVGKWDDGKTPFQRFSTYAYGHPRRSVVSLLESKTSASRDPAKSGKVADKVKSFSDMTISKGIYSTGWDGTIKVKATAGGILTITTSN